MTATEQLAADADFVIGHALRDEDGFYGIHAPDHDLARFAVRVAETRFGNHHELAVVIGWVLTALPWTGRFRKPTPRRQPKHVSSKQPLRSHEADRCS